MRDAKVDLQKKQDYIRKELLKKRSKKENEGQRSDEGKRGLCISLQRMSSDVRGQNKKSKERMVGLRRIGLYILF